MTPFEIKGASIEDSQRDWPAEMLGEPFDPFIGFIDHSILENNVLKTWKIYPTVVEVWLFHKDDN